MENPGAGCQVDHVPDDCGRHKTRRVHFALPSIDLPVPFFHHQCIHNEVISIVNRVLGETPIITDEGRRLMRKGAKRLSQALPKTTEQRVGEFAYAYSGAKRQRYLDAAVRSLNGYSQKDAGVTMMVKVENCIPDKSKLNPDPRAVQFRDPVYCVQLAKFLKPMEHNLYELKIDHPLLATKTRLVGKGLNQVQRGALLFEKLAGFTDPVMIVLDCKRFDKHVGVDQLKAEHSVYLASNPNAELAKLLRWQLINKCRTRSGIRYRTLGKRMSGDMNTALGNCIITIIMVFEACADVLKIKFDLMDDGDDCVLIVESSNLDLCLKQLPLIFLEYGHILKVENWNKIPEKISWCQSSVINMGKYYKFVRDPIRTMSNDLVSSKFLSQNHRSHLLAVGLCEHALNRGVPVLQAYARALIRNSLGANLSLDQNSSLYLRARREVKDLPNYRCVDEEITIQTRLSFELAFGISTQQQVVWERRLSEWVINDSGCRTFLRTYNSAWEIDRPIVER